VAGYVPATGGKECFVVPPNASPPSLRENCPKRIDLCISLPLPP
jgi:hypothetical protein